jgi:alpha-tubulin suppressor-like RCC1 family protein
VYSFGRNEFGELGIGSSTVQMLPQKITFKNNEKISKIFSNVSSDGCFFYSS